MKADRSNWTVRKVTFAEAEEIDNAYYASLSPEERLVLLMDLRSAIEVESCRIEPIVIRRNLYEKEV